MSGPAGTQLVLWDRQEQREVLTVFEAYANAMCLEHVIHGVPFTALERWFNELSSETLASEGLPPHKQVWDPGEDLSELRICPKCRSTEVKWDGQKMEGCTHLEEWRCNHCGYLWEDIFHLMAQRPAQP